MTLDLTCPSTYQLLQSFPDCSGPNTSFDMPASLEYLSSLSRASLAKTGAEVQEEPHLDIRPTLQRLPYYCTPAAVVDADVLDPTPEEFAVSNPSAKVIAKAEASQKRKASTSGSASGHVAKHTRSAVARESDDDDDACYEIPIVTPIRSGKGIMIDADAVAAPSVGASRPRVSSGPAPSFRELSRDTIHIDFFPFSLGPYYATYHEGGIAGNCKFTREEWDAPHQPTLKVLTKEVFKDPSVCKTVVDQFLTSREMVRIEALSSDQLTSKMSVLHCLMMLHGGELLARYRGLLQSYHEYLSASDASLAKSKAKGKERKKKIKSLTKSLDNLHAEVAHLSADLNRVTVLKAEKDEEIICLKATPPAFASFFQGQFQALVRKFLASDEFSRVQAELLSLAASAGFERGLSMHRTKKEFAATDYAFLNKISEHAAEPLFVILQLEPKKLARSANVPALRDACVSPPIVKESNVTLASTSLELLCNIVPTSSAAALEPNEEWVNAMVDEPDNEMVDAATNDKPGDVFLQGVSYVVDDVTEFTVTWLKHASSSLGDVVVSLSAGEKGDGSIPSSTIEEVATPSFRA
ncbi:hypothetical protein Tco_0087540 [Tanacetum coccineum]